MKIVASCVNVYVQLIVHYFHFSILLFDTKHKKEIK